MCSAEFTNRTAIRCLTTRCARGSRHSSAIAVPQPRVGRPHQKNAGDDAAVARCAADSGYRTGRVRANGKRRGARWLNRQPGHSLHPRAASNDCATGDILADEQAQVARKEDVLGSLSEMATQVRERLGESLVTIEKYSRPLQEATTSSWTRGRRSPPRRRCSPHPAARGLCRCSSVPSRSIRTSRSPMRGSESIKQ